MESQVMAQLKPIAEQLKQAREERGIPLDDIAAKTFIPLRLLKAMDEGKFERLPEPVFVQGFIRRYADLVGLNGMELCRQLVLEPPTVPSSPNDLSGQSGEVQPVLKADAADPVSLSERVARPIASLDKVLSRAKPTWAKLAAVTQSKLASKPGAFTWLYWLGGGVGVLLLGVWVINAIGRSRSPDHSSPAVSTQIVPAPTLNSAPGSTSTDQPQATPSSAAAQQPSVQPSAAVSPSPTPSNPVADGPVKVSVQLTEDSWLEVVADGKILLSETLPKGTQRSWSANQDLVITSGNARGVLVTYNQAPAQPMGTTSDPIELRFPPPPPSKQ